MTKLPRWRDALPPRMFEGSLQEDQDRLWAWLERRRGERERGVRFEQGIPVTPVQGAVLDLARKGPVTLGMVRATWGREGAESVKNLAEAGLVVLRVGRVWATWDKDVFAR